MEYMPRLCPPPPYCLTTRSGENAETQSRPESPRTVIQPDTKLDRTGIRFLRVPLVLDAFAFRHPPVDLVVVERLSLHRVVEGGNLHELGFHLVEDGVRVKSEMRLRIRNCNRLRSES